MTEGDTVKMDLSVTNSGPAVSFAAVLDEIPDGTALVSGEPVFCGPLPNGETVTATYTLRADRGVHVQATIRVLVWARLGLSLDEYRFDCPTFVAALPRVETLPTIRIRPRKTHTAVGPVKARVAGPGVEFFGCRAYVPGDDIRRVNWRSFAKYDRPFVNEHEDERMTDVIVVLDVRVTAHVRSGVESTFEPSCRAAASLVAHFIRQGNRVGFLLYGQTVDWIQPAGGRFHLEKILGTIARAHPARSFAFENLANLPLQMLPSGSQIVVVSPLSRAGDALVAAKLRARGCSVLVIYADSLELEREAQPPDDALETGHTGAQARDGDRLPHHGVPWRPRHPVERSPAPRRGHSGRETGPCREEGPLSAAGIVLAAVSSGLLGLAFAASGPFYEPLAAALAGALWVVVLIARPKTPVHGLFLFLALAGAAIVAVRGDILLALAASTSALFAWDAVTMQRLFSTLPPARPTPDHDALRSSGARHGRRRIGGARHRSPRSSCPRIPRRARTGARHARSARRRVVAERPRRSHRRGSAGTRRGRRRGSQRESGQPLTGPPASTLCCVKRPTARPTPRTPGWQSGSRSRTR